MENQASKVVRVGFLENEESNAVVLNSMIQQGLSSPRVENFDFDEHLTKLKSEKNKNG